MFSFYSIHVFLLPRKTFGGGSTDPLTQSPPAGNSWPDSTTYQPFTCGGQIAYDGVGDTNGASNDRDIVGDASFPAAQFKTTISHLFIRLRLDDDPRHGSGQNLGLSPFGWGIAFDTNNNRANYEYAAIANGVADKMQLYAYTGDGVNPSATPLAEGDFNMPGTNPWVKVSTADSAFSTNTDYYLDIAVPLTELQNKTSSRPYPFSPGVIKIWIATSANGTTMSADYMCWTGTVSDANLQSIPLTTAGIGAFASISSPTTNATLTTLTPMITGTATPGTTVTLTLNSPAHSTTFTSSSTGQWTYVIPSSWSLLFGDMNKTLSASVSGGGSGSSVNFNIGCPSGYVLPSGQPTSPTCDDINECTSGTHNCGAMTCTNTPGSFTCGCNSGFTFNGSTCVNGSVIITTPATWETTYNSTTPVLAGRLNITDVGANSIYLDKKSDGDSILISSGSSTTLNMATILSTDNPRWMPGSSPAPDLVTQVSDQWNFSVPSSWGLLFGKSYLIGVGLGTGQTVQTVRINISCTQGYTPTPNPSTTCSDVDECVTNTDNCDSSHGICTNLQGSFSCSCATNYSGNGITCTANPTYSLALNAPSGSVIDVVTPTFSGVINRSDGSTTSPLSGIIISITHQTHSSNVTTSADGSWSFTVPSHWGWQMGQDPTVVLTVWDDTLTKNLSLRCSMGYLLTISCHVSLFPQPLVLAQALPHPYLLLLQPPCPYLIPYPYHLHHRLQAQFRVLFQSQLPLHIQALPHRQVQRPFLLPPSHQRIPLRPQPKWKKQHHLLK
jgi:hypothetical protein